MSTPIDGGCLCRAVRYRSQNPPLAARTCWCRLCQYLGGGGPTSNAGFPSDGFTIEGEVRWHTSLADSGNILRRGFCPACGTPLFSKADVRPHILFVRMGSLDDPGIIAPGATIWAEAAPAWAAIDPAIPTIDRQPPPIA